MQVIKLFLLCLFASPIICISQDEKKPIKFILQTSVGVNFTNRSFMTGAITDHLIAQRTTPSLCLQLSANYFYKNWGFGSTISFTQENSREPFIKDVNDYYSNYYVNSYHRDHKNTYTTKGLFGPAYKIEKGNFIIINKLQFGISQLSIWTDEVYLKEKNTNTILNVEWSSPDLDKDYFCFNPSVSLGYRIDNNFILNIDINYYVTPINISFTEKTRNIYTAKSEVKYYKYNRNIQELSIGISMIYILNKRKPLTKA